jgi:hypothetical protein
MLADARYDEQMLAPTDVRMGSPQQANQWRWKEKDIAVNSQRKQTARQVEQQHALLKLMSGGLKSGREDRWT